MFEKTNAVRKSLKALGIHYRRGYRTGHINNGSFCYENTVDEDSVTTAFPVRGADGVSVTFEEDEDGLHVVDDLTPEQAVAVVLAASGEGRWQ